MNTLITICAVDNDGTDEVYHQLQEAGFTNIERSHQLDQGSQLELFKITVPVYDSAEYRCVMEVAQESGGEIEVNDQLLSAEKSLKHQRHRLALARQPIV